MAKCLIISADAKALENEISRCINEALSCRSYTSVEAALDGYDGQRILFGSPDLLAAVLPKFANVDWVQSSWAGVTPLMAIDRRDYTLTCVRGIFGPQISEYVFGYLLAHELKVLERAKQQGLKNWFDAPSGFLHGKRLGIMGTGSIGAHIAQTAKAFGMKVRGLSASGRNVRAFDGVQPANELHAFLDGLDYLVTTLPQTDATSDLLNEAALARLPSHAYLVNVGRGNVIDDEALVGALDSGRLAGAALDVFDVEPLPDDSPLWTAKNLSVTGHIAAISHPSLIVPIFVDNYRRFTKGEPLTHVVDFDKGY